MLLSLRQPQYPRRHRLLSRLERLHQPANGVSRQALRPHQPLRQSARPKQLRGKGAPVHHRALASLDSRAWPPRALLLARFRLITAGQLLHGLQKHHLRRRPRLPKLHLPRPPPRQHLQARVHRSPPTCHHLPPHSFSRVHCHQGHPSPRSVLLPELDLSPIARQANRQADRRRGQWEQELTASPPWTGRSSKLKSANAGTADYARHAIAPFLASATAKHG